MLACKNSCTIVTLSPEELHKESTRGQTSPNKNYQGSTNIRTGDIICIENLKLRLNEGWKGECNDYWSDSVDTEWPIKNKTWYKIKKKKSNFLSNHN